MNLEVLAGLIDGLTTGTSLGWTNPRVVAGLVVGAGCLVAYYGGLAAGPSAGAPFADMDIGQQVI